MDLSKFEDNNGKELWCPKVYGKYGQLGLPVVAANDIGRAMPKNISKHTRNEQIRISLRAAQSHQGVPHSSLHAIKSTVFVDSYSDSRSSLRKHAYSNILRITIRPSKHVVR